jgi:hypothetical protein
VSTRRFARGRGHANQYSAWQARFSKHENLVVPNNETNNARKLAKKHHMMQSIELGVAAPSAWQTDVAKRLLRSKAARNARTKRQNGDKQWTHWGLNPGPSACEADVIPLHHVPSWCAFGASGHDAHATSAGTIGAQIATLQRATPNQDKVEQRRLRQHRPNNETASSNNFVALFGRQAAQNK